MQNFNFNVYFYVYISLDKCNNLFLKKNETSFANAGETTPTLLNFY